MTGQTDTDYSIRQATYDLRKIRGKQLIHKAGRTRRYHVPPDAARTFTALLTLREHVIAPILAGVRSPRLGRKPASWTSIDRAYEQLRINMTPCSTTSASPPPVRPHRQHFVDAVSASAYPSTAVIPAAQRSHSEIMGTRPR